MGNRLLNLTFFGVFGASTAAMGHFNHRHEGNPPSFNPWNNHFDGGPLVVPSGCVVACVLGHVVRIGIGTSFCQFLTFFLGFGSICCNGAEM